LEKEQLNETDLEEMFANIPSSDSDKEGPEEELKNLTKSKSLENLNPS
jgi:hypothetical protein